jgi:hypothetical protein
MTLMKLIKESIEGFEVENVSGCSKHEGSEFYRGAKTFQLFDTRNALISIPGKQVSSVIVAGIGAFDKNPGVIGSNRVG